MKTTILKGEAILQAIISLVFFLYAFADYNRHTPGSEFFIALFYIGVSNLIGFLLRVSLSKSRFHRYYFYGVILFFVILYFMAVLFSDSKMDYVINFMGIGGVIFNMYYLGYGFYMVKTMHQNKTAE
ncbi:hypothetical protein [uncultured Chryseobacterium sp.]|uniref:hypothetical protein n=1 Tax=uncultured Chryseobacterium sp. TaxID=259322 RepID=UPI0025D10EB1|nr:hypothetical protein [uncultured Chryseobacterium sp.]